MSLESIRSLVRGAGHPEAEILDDLVHGGPAVAWVTHCPVRGTEYHLARTHREACAALGVRVARPERAMRAGWVLRAAGTLVACVAFLMHWRAV